jgi:hypothetical protein
MRQILAITLIILSINTLYTQTKKSKDITSIKKMCGCFEISFDFEIMKKFFIQIIKNF